MARLGGDEFAILLPAADREGAERVAGVVVERGARQQPHARGRQPTGHGEHRRGHLRRGARAGRGRARPRRHADVRRQGCRAATGSPCSTTAPRCSRAPAARMEWKARIEAALENDEFELVPAAAAAPRHRPGHQRRGADPAGRPRRPGVAGAFIGVAERAGLAPAVDSWVVRHGIALLGRLLEVDPAMRLSVNLSAHSIGDPAIAAHHRARAARARRRPASAHGRGHRDRRRRRRRRGPPVRRAAAGAGLSSSPSTTSAPATGRSTTSSTSASTRSRSTASS